MLDTVKVPAPFAPIFEMAQEYVRRYFAAKRFAPTEGTIDIFGERYILVRAASMSVEFFETVASLYESEGAQEAHHIARQLLFDIAHAIGKQDARAFHSKLGVKQPIERLSAGPVHFAHTGWAFVDILPESRPTPDSDYLLLYDHPYSFEAAAWLAAGRTAEFPVCVMNAGYSSGWCEESFGLTLVAAEVTCRARGDAACRFVMAPPDRIEQRIASYVASTPELAPRITHYEVPGFFARKEVEARLRRSEAQLRGIANGVPGMLYQFCARRDGSFALTYLSDKAGEVLGLECAPEQAFEEIIQRTDARDRELFVESIKHGRPDQPWKLEWRYRKPSGELVWLQGNSVPELRDGQLVFNGIVRDVTARKQMEERNAHLTSVLRAIRNINQLITKEKDRARLIDGVCNGLVDARGFFGAWLVLHDRDGRASGCAAAGFEEGSLSFLEHLAQGLRPGCAARALHGAAPIAVAADGACCAGCPLQRECRERGGLISALRHGQRSYGLLFVSTPASFADDPEELSLFEELAGDVAFALHSLELEEERRQRVERLATLGQLAAGVGHELRNPLAAIKNAAYFLKLGVEPSEPEAQETLEILEREVGSAERIIDSLLTFARPRPPSKRLVQPNELVAQALQRCPPPAGIALCTALAPELPSVLADPEQLLLALGNLILNALQAMTGAGQLTIRSALRAGQIELCVSDTGHGIPPGELERIFEPLYTTKAKGMGLGLAISRMLVQSNGGTIAAASAEHGSTFTLTVPIS